MQSEVNFLGRLSHPNLVRLLGYCVEDRELLLVYEYMPKGSLDNHLFRSESSLSLCLWNVYLLCLLPRKYTPIGLIKTELTLPKATVYAV